MKPYNLTSRELTVLGLVATGAADKEIAQELVLSVFTVHKHVQNILGKMDVPSRTAAAVKGLRGGLVPSPAPRSALAAVVVQWDATDADAYWWCRP